MERTWDDKVILVGTGGYEEDELGQQAAIPRETTVCCCKQPISRQEFYLAGQSGIRVSEILIIHPYEYNGESTVVFNGKRLTVIKTYPISQEELELTCVEKLGDKNGKKNPS